MGVIRNGGRLGARWAPPALLAMLAKLSLPAHATSVLRTEVTSQTEESEDFVESQKLEEERLTQTLSSFKKILHIGGGHDHILPLLRSLGREHPIVVINIDAHCDTRIETEPHSGNPFRLYDAHAPTPLQLYQIGIHPFANSRTTLSDLPRGNMSILYRQDCDDTPLVMAYLAQLQSQIPDNARVVFSLDCDALAASEVGAVSAPNHHGLSLSFVIELIQWYRTWCQDHQQREYYGVYEFNPLYDTVSASSARAIAGLLFEMMKLE